MRAATLKGWLWVHKWSSLVSMLFMLMLCLTGLPLIFSDEIRDWQSPPPTVEAVAPGTIAPALETLAHQALSVRPTGHILVSMTFREHQPQTVRIVTSSTGVLPSPGMYIQAFDQRNGKLLPRAEAPMGFKWVMPFMRVMRQLHVDMYAGLPGMLFLGCMGLLVFVAVVSGVVVYAPFMRKLDFGTVRTDRAPRLRWLDLHNLLGIVTVVWVSVVALTGVINTLAPLITSHWKATDMEQVIRPYRQMPPVENRIAVEKALTAARAVAPDMHLFNFIFPGTALSSPHHYAAMYEGNTPLTKRVMSFSLVDASTGEVVVFVRMPWHMKTLFVSQPLHFGDYGGLPLKIIWTLLTLMTIAVLGSGIYLWLKKPSGGKAKIRPLKKAKESIT